MFIMQLILFCVLFTLMVKVGVGNNVTDFLWEINGIDSFVYKAGISR